MARIGKTEIVTAVANKGLSIKDAKKAVDAVIEFITNEVNEGNTVNIVGFGKFEQVDRKERQARNPQTGEMFTVPAHKAVRFKAGKDLKR